jgi:hypothetical protein
MPTKAAVIPVRSPIMKGIRKSKSRGEAPRSSRKAGIPDNKGDISIVLLKIITEAIRKSISQEKLSLIAKNILFPFIFATARKIPVIVSRARINSILKTRTKKIIARIGHMLMMKLRRPLKTSLGFFLLAEFWGKEIFLMPKNNPAKIAARVKGN